jgi:hypothetical protein
MTPFHYVPFGNIPLNYCSVRQIVIDTTVQRKVRSISGKRMRFAWLGHDRAECDRLVNDNSLIPAVVEFGDGLNG